MTQFPLPPEIRSLPIPERFHLVEQIWDSIIEDEGEFGLTDAHKAELDQRIAAYEADPNRGLPWEEVKKRIMGEQ
jgi:putative addiction module component (TIGR02574 family)